MRTRLRMSVGFATALVAVGLGGQAQAFFFRGWPGSGLPKPPVLITPTAPTDDNPPSGRPPEDDQPPGKPTNPQGPNGPNGVPEPGTLVLAAAGLGVLALRRRKRKT